MPRSPRVCFEGAIYHVMFRGNAKQDLFLDGRDASRFLEALADREADHSVRIYLYCMMPNHVHLLVETPLGNLSRFMAALLTAYSLYFNKRHDRVGHVMQGRFKSCVVSGDEYLLRLTRYIHLNPVRTKEWEDRSIDDRIQFLHHFRWSSYRSYIGLCETDNIVTYGPIMKMVPHAQNEDLQAAYRRYVEAGLGTTDDEIVEALRHSPASLGSTVFQSELQERINRDGSALRSVQSSLSADDVIACVVQQFGVSGDRIHEHRKENWPRAAAAQMLAKYSNMTQAGIAKKFGLHSNSAVCHMIRRLKNACALDHDLAAKIETISSVLGDNAATE
ncbi:MAG: transposase [Verrucomicrobia bacterium]|nr:transposase [Verrucomicrobiota bacterium]